MNAVTLTGRLVCSTPAEAERVARHLPRHRELSSAEPGCLAFVVEPTSDPHVWSVAERFVDRAAFDAHQVRAALSEWGRNTAGILREYTVTESDASGDSARAKPTAE
ncbi:antibiotic biosynthesis monooxygenase [Micrococcales bacterium 31B]|nr:antibiotic biosynthesis monooxygenase [Micrococcales bacterium 31B]